MIAERINRLEKLILELQEELLRLRRELEPKNYPKPHRIEVLNPLHKTIKL